MKHKLVYSLLSVLLISALNLKPITGAATTITRTSDINKNNNDDNNIQDVKYLNNKLESPCESSSSDIDKYNNCLDLKIKHESEFMRYKLSQNKPKWHEIKYRSSKFNPVIFIPGDGGSQLEARLNKTYRVHYICAEQSDWYDIWLNLHLMGPLLIDCLYDNMKLHYDNKTRTTNNTQGVDIRARDFGSIDSVTYLDILHVPKTDYFENIVATLEKQNNLTRNVDMLGASFDFRKAPNELELHFKNLTSLIETLYAQSNYRPITLICHSMGCLNSLHLLNQKSDIWKEIHIKRLITLGAPWDGSFKAISSMFFGDNLGIPLLDTKKLRVIQSSFPSLMYLFPKGPTFENLTLVETLNTNYTLNDLDQLLTKANLSDQLEMWRDTRKIANNLKAPNVEIWCLYGSGYPTPKKLIISNEISAAIDSWKYNEIQGDGDGTVNIESLEACKSFRQQQREPVYTREFQNIDHIEILRGKSVADIISREILMRDLS